MSSSLDICWKPLPGGKHAGRTLPQVMFSDPDYFFYLYSADPRSFAEVRGEAEIIADRARNISIPPLGGCKRAAEYLMDERHPWRFKGIVLVNDGHNLPNGFVTKGRKDVLDLSLPRLIAPHDRNACKALVPHLKEIAFGDPSIRVQRSRAENFFNDQSRFARFALPKGASW